MRLQYLLMNRTCVSLQSAVSGANVGANVAAGEQQEITEVWTLCWIVCTKSWKTVSIRRDTTGCVWVRVPRVMGGGVAAGRKWTSFRDASKILRSVSFDVNQTERNINQTVTFNKGIIVTPDK